VTEPRRGRGGRCRKPDAPRWALYSLVVAAALIVAPALSAQDVVEQAVVTWSKPVNLSMTATCSLHPEVVADDLGNVHVLWSEDLGGEAVPDGEAGEVANGTALVYRRWDGYGWSKAVDVLRVDSAQVADFPSAVVDGQGRLHVVWAGGGYHYYSSALADEAETARGWRAPLALASGQQGSWPNDIATDGSGILYVVYASSDDLVKCTRSTDGGLRWEVATVLSEPLAAPEASLANVRLLVDPAGYLHATWQTNQPQGYGQGLYYARSLDGGRTWSRPVQFAWRGAGDTFAEYLRLAARGAGELHAIYVYGWHVGRWHTISPDGGGTWSAPHHILTGMEGINGFVVPVVDGLDQLHLVINMRTASQVYGIFTAVWLGDKWSPVRVVDASGPEGLSAAHYAAATVALGTDIHVVWTQPHGSEVLHVRGRISNALSQ